MTDVLKDMQTAPVLTLDLLLKQLSRLSVLMMAAIVKDSYKIFIIKE